MAKPSSRRSAHPQRHDPVRLRRARSKLWVAISAATPSCRISPASARTRTSLVAGSRLPVGSSARMMRGWLAAARAMATRCCAARQLGRPVLGPRADAEQVEQFLGAQHWPPPAPPRRSAAAWRHSRWPRIPAAGGGTGRRNRWCCGAAACEPRSLSLLVGRPVMVHLAACGRSSGPARCSGVDLPAPDGATMATSSPPLHGRGRRASSTRTLVSPSPSVAVHLARARGGRHSAKGLDRIVLGGAPTPDKACAGNARAPWPRRRHGEHLGGVGAAGQRGEVRTPRAGRW